ncbi:MAG: 1,4-alpha-glucan branching protein GlgB, partial [Puniceicoccales bacterium]|nr:1,4-alpha-glucan branching protein GlgB [Puniceicoccales bacterium]
MHFPPTIPAYDLHLFGEGKALRMHHFLGAHRREHCGVLGVSFALWAPDARHVSVVGDFNGWDGRRNRMHPLGQSGVWEIFVPRLDSGHLYKFELLDCNGNLQLRTDPCGLAFEDAVTAAAIVTEEDSYIWHDSAWMDARKDFIPFRSAISIYELHLGSWKRVPEEEHRPLRYREIAPLLAKHCVDMGFSHVELLPLAEFPFEGSWGYQTTGYFAPTVRYGSPDDFKYFVDTLHRAGIGVIMDWVPSHFPKDRFALAEFDGTCLYEHADRRIGEHYGWGTLVFNYGRHEVANFLLCSALSWCERYHVDGFRVDAVASMIYRNYNRESGEWIPNAYGGCEHIEAIEFLRNFNVLVHRQFPGIMTIAEESTSFPNISKPVHCNGLGFDFKWNMGWMHDTLRYFSLDPVHRKYAHNHITFAMLYQYSEHFILALSHDEVVHGKGSLLRRMPSDHMETKCAMLRSLYGYMWTWPGKKSLFMGGEFGQHDEWCHFRSLDWHLLQFSHHGGLMRWVRDLNFLYRSHLWLGNCDDEPGGFQWINADDGNCSVLSYLRCGRNLGEKLLIVCNFTPI